MARSNTGRSSLMLSIGSVVAAVGLWQIISTYWLSPFFLPSPTAVALGAWHLSESGVLERDAAVSLMRIVTGWLMGGVIGVPVGLAVGSSRIAKSIVDPFVHFFRFIPALALVTLFMVWLGVGEASKIALVAYATAFIVTVTTATGVASIPEDRLNAAKCLGATGMFLFARVRVPATVPHIYTAMRLALANAFLVIIAVEMIAANSGIGYLIWTSRLYFKIDWLFVGILLIGSLGLIADRLWRLLGRTVLGRYVRGFGSY
ncbi:MAG: ABC transporter permease [Acidimicrobiales bacterium]